MACTSHLLDLHGATLAYTTVGDGPVVIHAHGLGHSRTVTRQLALFDVNEVVAAGFRCVSFDARGHGQSTGLATGADYTWPRLADDLLALVDHVSPDRPVDAIGLSMGTGTLLHAALKRPGRFRRLVLTAAPTAWGTRPAQARMYRSLATLVDRHGAEAVRRAWAVAAVPAIFADRVGYPPEPDIDPALLPEVYRGAAMSDLPAPERLATLEHPALLLAWSGDPAHPLSTASALASFLPGATLEVAHQGEDVCRWGSRIAGFLGGP